MNIQTLIKECGKAHAAKLEADRAYEKARKALYGAMHDAEMHTAQCGDYVATVERAQREVCDVYKLRQLVGDEKFMQIVTASKAEVVKHAGTGVVNAVVTLKEGNENVTLEKRK